jgi:hypothetical protein
MADAAAIRQWLNQNGRPQSVNGRIAADDRAFFNAAHGQADETEPETVAEETQPRSGRRARTRKPPAARASGFARTLIGGGGKKKPAARKQPRVSLEKFVGRSWAMMGRMAMSASPPMGRCIQAQAPMAGVILDDITRGTIADRLLQPVARAEDKLDKIFALTAPPLLVLALDMSSSLPPAEFAARQAILVPMLREALRVSLEVSEAYAEAITERLVRDQRFDEQVDKLIGMIFGQVAAEPEPANA